LNDSGGELVVAPLGTAWGRRASVALVLKNLVSNALKFMPPGRQPRVQVQASRRGDDLRITVSDNGIGIEPDKLAQLGTPFRRLHARRKYEGTGLGLAICKRIAEQHGGGIEIDSTPGEGSRFTLVLPDRRIEAPADASPSRQACTTD
jgi:signal transduction histidine kinase